MSDLKSNHELDKLLLPARAVRDTVNKSVSEDLLAQFSDAPKDSNQSVLVIVDQIDQNEDEASVEINDKGHRARSVQISNNSLSANGDDAARLQPAASMSQTKLEQAIMDDRADKL